MKSTSIFMTMYRVIGIFAILFLSPLTISGQAQNIQFDGIIEVDEYDFHLEIEDGIFNLYWTLDGDRIHFGISAETNGYIGLNIDPGVILTDADLYYGWVEDGTDSMVDTYSTEITGPVKLDTDGGGSDDILQFAGTEVNGITTFEFTRMLETGDNRDNNIKINGMKVSWTIGPNDDISSRPADSGRLDVNFSTGHGEELFDWIPWIIGGIIVLLILLIFFGFRYFRKRRLRSKSITANETPTKQ